MIVAEHATQEGSYVALTRARDRTTIYAARDVDTEDGHETALTALAERMSRIEPEVPSLHVPLAHEAAVTREIETVQSDPGPDRRTQRDDASDDVQGPRYLTDTLGPRPSQDDASRPAWDAGARAITQHRTRYQVTDDAAGPLGNEPPAGRFRERHDYHQAQAAISQAQDTLGWTPEPGPEQPVHRPRSDRPLERHAELDGYEP
jgi:ATP-dependent exoDNAse (exonuclease V) beta subunit